MNKTIILIIAAATINDMIDRVKAALELGRQLAADVVFVGSGGQSKLFTGSDDPLVAADASWIARMLKLFGIKAEDIILEYRSKSMSEAFKNTILLLLDMLPNWDELYIIAGKSELMKIWPTIEEEYSQIAQKIRYWPIKGGT